MGRQDKIKNKVFGIKYALGFFNILPKLFYVKFQNTFNMVIDLKDCLTYKFSFFLTFKG